MRVAVAFAGRWKPVKGEETARSDASSAIAVDAPGKVDALHRKAMLLGAKDEGAPGPRGGGFYAAYLRDLDGNKLNVFCLT